jgi:hypothetical protein
MGATHRNCSHQPLRAVPLATKPVCSNTMRQVWTSKRGQLIINVGAMETHFL